MPPKRKANGKEVPKSPVKSDYRRMLQLMVEKWPSLRITPGAKEIENKDSELSKIRNDCFLTASMAGVLWNCKRGVSLGKFIRVARGLEEMPPPSDFARALMDKGVEMEPVILSHFSAVASAEFKRLLGGEMTTVTPGPITMEFEGVKTSATPDALVFLTDAPRMRTWSIPVEIKFFASKTEFPSEIPNDYLAQILCQAIHMGSRMALLLAGVRTDEDEVLFKVWVLRITPEAIDAYYELLQAVKEEVEKNSERTRFPNVGAELQSLIVYETTDCCSLWEFILSNRDLLVSHTSESDNLTFPSNR